MPSITLSEVVTAGYDRIVFDTSVLDATCASPEVKRAYRREIRRELCREELVTARPVAIEAQRHFNSREDREFMNEIRASCFDIESAQNTYRECFNALVPGAIMRGIITPDLKGLKTDVKLAALAFTLAQTGFVAFVSGDRALVDLVYEFQRSRPVIVDPYYFWQGQAKFKLYDGADAALYRSRMRIAV